MKREKRPRSCLDRLLSVGCLTVLVLGGIAFVLLVLPVVLEM